MEKTRKYKEFVENNIEALRLLSEKVKSVDTVHGAETLQEVRGRKYAIKIVGEWLTELWGITTEDLPKPEDEDELFRRVE